MTKEINDLLLKMHNLQGTNHDKAANNLINMIKIILIKLPKENIKKDENKDFVHK